MLLQLKTRGAQRTTGYSGRLPGGGERGALKDGEDLAIDFNAVYENISQAPNQIKSSTKAQRLKLLVCRMTVKLLLQVRWK